MKALVTGGTGFLGRHLLGQLEGPVVLTRDVARARSALGSAATCVAWQPQSELVPASAFAGVDTVFHLAGDPVADGRWTPAKKARIKDSRVLGTRNLVAALQQLPRPPRVLVAASGADYYGHRGDAELDESAGPGRTFLAEVCQAWEAESLAAARLGVRVVVLRLGLVLAPRGGALARMLPPFRLGLGGKLGGGEQWMPWIHIDDVLGLLLHAARTETLQGPVNAVGPEAVTNAEFTRVLGRVLGRPTIFAVPRVALRVAFGELSQPLLDSKKVVPRAALASGYAFRFPRLHEALQACVSDPEAAGRAQDVAAAKIRGNSEN